MNEILLVIIMGVLLAFVMQGIKVWGPWFANPRKAIRIIVAAAALAIAYFVLRDTGELAIDALLVYAGGIIAAAETVYRWLVKPVAEINL